MGREVVGGREERREEESRERKGRKTNSSNHRRCVCESLKEWTGSNECYAMAFEFYNTYLSSLKRHFRIDKTMI